jgi:hypothetical protein
MATSAQYASVSKTGINSISTANTARNGTGTIVTIFTAGSSGSRIERINVVAQATTTAGMVRLFIHDGTTAWLYEEIPVAANTPSGTNPAFSASIQAFTNPDLMPLTLPTGYSLRAATNNAETFNVIAVGGDF